MELLVEKKLANSWFRKSKIYLTYRNEILFYVDYINKGLFVVNARTHENELLIKEKRGWASIKYSIVKGEEILNFKAISSFRMHYQFVSENNVYEIFGHKKLKYSIFENGQQIGYFIESSSSIQYKIMYKIECNSDSNKPLIFSFLLILNMYNDEGNDGVAFSYKYGPLWKTKKDFDIDWKPR